MGVQIPQAPLMVVATKPTPKKLSRAQQHAFWFALDRGAVKPSTKRKLYWARNRAPVKISSSIAGTVREFRNREDLQEHIRLVNATNKLGKKTSFSTFHFVPIQILSADRKNFRITEKILLGPNVQQVLTGDPKNGFDSPYGAHVWRKLQEKKVSLSELRASIREALHEINSKIRDNIPIDAYPANVVVVGFDEKARLPRLAIVDHGPY